MNKNELLIGFILTLCLTPLMGPLGLLAIIVCPFLYALSGMNGQDKVWRRLVMPIIWALAILEHNHNMSILVAIPCTFGALSIGYGLRDTSDEGSVLGNFYLDRFQGNYWLANFFTRSTIYFLALLPMIWLR